MKSNNTVFPFLFEYLYNFEQFEVTYENKKNLQNFDLLSFIVQEDLLVESKPSVCQWVEGSTNKPV